MNEIYLVRHGNANYDTDTLTEKGKRDAEGAAEFLLPTLLGRSGLVLCSDAGRAYETADIIARKLGFQLTASRRINIGGNDPQVVANLDSFIEESIKVEAVGYDRPNDPLIVVTHAPLIAIAKGYTPEDTNYVVNGEVVRYQPGSWSGKYYDSEIEDRLLQQ